MLDVMVSKRFYEKTLSRDSEDLFANFFVEIFSNVKKTIASSEGEGSIVSTIELHSITSLRTCEKIQDRCLRQARWDIINHDPDTYVQCSQFFDPNDFKDVEDPKVFSNPLVEEVRMGSIIKR